MDYLGGKLFGGGTKNIERNRWDIWEEIGQATLYVFKMIRPANPRFRIKNAQEYITRL